VALALALALALVLVLVLAAANHILVALPWLVDLLLTFMFGPAGLLAFALLRLAQPAIRGTLR